MLCSHTKKFVYLKTLKTAGTSVEIFLNGFAVLGKAMKNYTARVSG